MSKKATFKHPNYSLVDGEKIVRNPNAPPLTAAEDGEILDELARYVEAKLIVEYKFESIPISEDDNSTTSILGSANWINATKLLLIIQNAYGSQLGIFSRSICFDEGLSKGTWLLYIQRAVSAGYGVLILRPNTNSVTIGTQTTNATKKAPIKGSESPEIHALNVWENIVSRAESVTHIALLGYGNGASLCKDLYLREMVNTDNGVENRIKAIVAIEASSIVSKDDSLDVQEALANITINLELSASASIGHRLAYRKEQLGCVSLSLGIPPGVTHLTNVAAGVNLALHTVFKYLAIAESCDNPSKSFPIIMARDNGLDATTAVVLVNPQAADEPTPLPLVSGINGAGAGRVNGNTKVHVSNALPTPQAPTPNKKIGFFSRIFGGGNNSNTAAASNEDKLTVADFDLLKIVGKGAFGKVMLVRKKTDNGAEGQVYAMKVLKKSAISAQGQVENTKSERDILFEVRHPYIVRLRFAFQSEDKLYLVTDYYNGGTLYYHLRKAEAFSEDRARFYAAELLSALDHLHQQNIIYRDLKLENVLMDHQGHLALTDFGLSKQNIDATGGATTFCGTAEYIAPELLLGQKYGPAVDWWSFGILL